VIETQSSAISPPKRTLISDASIGAGPIDAGMPAACGSGSVGRGSTRWIAGRGSTSATPTVRRSRSSQSMARSRSRKTTVASPPGSISRMATTAKPDENSA
jgi:hypothetical protein